MRLLQKIEELNLKGKHPTINELLQQDGILDSLVKLDVSKLLKIGYLEEISVPDESCEGYSRIGNKITGKGKHALERFASQVRYFVSRLEETYEKDENEILYRTIEDNRDLLRFAYYRGSITKAQIEKMAKKLGINAERIWWGDRQGEILGDFGLLP